jgi:5-methylcytosine-specific restriction endonuclease McrA
LVFGEALMKTKLCIKCNVEKSIDQFYRNKIRKDGRYPYCKECCYKDYRKRYEKSEAHQRAVANRKYYDEHREEFRKAIHFRYNHSEKGRACQHRYNGSEKQKANKRRYVQSKKGRRRYRSYVQNRRAKRADNGGSYTPEEWKALCSLYDYRCLCCGEIFKFDELTVDHIIPIAKGGTSNIDNLQPLCMPCNKSKCDRIIDYRTKKVWWKQLALEL